MTWGPVVAATPMAAEEGFRLLAESRMTSRVTIRRRTGTAKVDGYDVPVWATTYADLPFRLDGTRSGSTSAQRVGAMDFPTADALAHFPHDTTDLLADDLIEVTAGEWVGTVWRLTGNPVGDAKTARRVPIEASQRPEEW